MTQRSQSRQHTGKRGAAQRKARREGYRFYDMDAGQDQQHEYSDRDWEWFFWRADYAKDTCPHLAAAFRHGAHDWARKHGHRQ